MGESREALELALQAERIGRDHLRLIAGILPERQALRYASVRASGLDLVLTLTAGALRHDPKAIQWAWDAVVRSRALVMDEIASRRRIVADTSDPEITHLADEFAVLSADLANLIIRGPRSLGLARYRELLDETRQEKERVENALARKSAIFSEKRKQEQVGLVDAAESLPTDSTLVAFVLYNRYEFSAEVEPAPATPSYLAFVLRNDRTGAVVVPLGPAEEIEKLISNWQAEVGARTLQPGRSDTRADADYRTRGEMLRRKVWDPIAPHVDEVRRIFIVPGGALHLVSFTSLPVDRREYLLERGPQIHYLSAERDLVSSGSRDRLGGCLLALGGADYDAAAMIAAQKSSSASSAFSPQEMEGPMPFRGERATCADFRQIEFEPLPASKREVEDVVSIWKTAGSSASSRMKAASGTCAEGEDGIVHFTGASASEEAFKKLAPESHVLHLATHGFFVGEHCPSALHATRGVGGGVISDKTNRSQARLENPLKLSGLAFAGANHRATASPEEEDGIVTSEEIAAMNLSNVEWAVLSACDTGLGEVKAGEGVLGLRRAFQVAGARTLIMSLWSVEDESARRWMKALYEGRLLKNLSTSEAVRQASLAVLSERRAKGESTHPFYWGAFVAAGDWR